MADFRSWLLRKDGGVEGRVADTRNCVGMEVRVCDSADVVDKIDELCSGVNVMYGEEEARVYGQGWSVHSVGQELRRHRRRGRWLSVSMWWPGLLSNVTMRRWMMQR